jgi:two-component system cell cycle response regulator
MDNPVLVVGDQEFILNLTNSYEQILPDIIITSFEQEVMSIIQQQPSIILVQASYYLNYLLLQEIKNQAHLHSIYIIVIAEIPNQLLEAELNTYIEQIELQAKMLENGADAYIQLKLNQDHHPSLYQSQERLLKAQIQVGLQQIDKYRELIQDNNLLSSIALADPLTNLNNRRALEWELPRQIEEACSHNQPLCLMVLDVDYFKSINDNHGHLVGDRLLQLIASRLQNNIRLQDSVFRYGGEEFVILLQDTNLQTAKFIAERIKQSIGEDPFPIEQTLTITVTISIGVSLLKLSDDPEGISLMYRADQNLLTAKSTGRNRIIYD